MGGYCVKSAKDVEKKSQMRILRPLNRKELVMSSKQQGHRSEICTRCGDELENFCFSPEAENLDALRTAALRCHIEGTKDGRVCAKVFIAGETSFTAVFQAPPPRVSRKTLLGVKDAILSMLGRERR